MPKPPPFEQTSSSPTVIPYAKRDTTSMKFRKGHRSYTQLAPGNRPILRVRKRLYPG